jgi:hypothetical protein
VFYLPHLIYFVEYRTATSDKFAAKQNYPVIQASFANQR